MGRAAFAVPLMDIPSVWYTTAISVDVVLLTRTVLFTVRRWKMTYGEGIDPIGEKPDLGTIGPRNSDIVSATSLSFLFPRGYHKF
jgi:hypothetical protein